MSVYAVRSIHSFSSAAEEYDTAGAELDEHSDLILNDPSVSGEPSLCGVLYTGSSASRRPFYQGQWGSSSTDGWDPSKDESALSYFDDRPWWLIERTRFLGGNQQSLVLPGFETLPRNDSIDAWIQAGYLMPPAESLVHHHKLFVMGRDPSLQTVCYRVSFQFHDRVGHGKHWSLIYTVGYKGLDCSFASLHIDGDWSQISDSLAPEVTRVHRVDIFDVFMEQQPRRQRMVDGWILRWEAEQHFHNNEPLAWKVEEGPWVPARRKNILPRPFLNKVQTLTYSPSTTMKSSAIQYMMEDVTNLLSRTTSDCGFGERTLVKKFTTLMRILTGRRTRLAHLEDRFHISSEDDEGSCGYDMGDSLWLSLPDHRVSYEAEWSVVRAHMGCSHEASHKQQTSDQTDRWRSTPPNSSAGLLIQGDRSLQAKDRSSEILQKSTAGRKSRWNRATLKTTNANSKTPVQLQSRVLQLGPQEGMMVKYDPRIAEIRFALHQNVSLSVAKEELETEWYRRMQL